MTPEEFHAILSSMPQAMAPKRRLYYDDAGRPRLYTMEDLPGEWIEVDALTYAIARQDIIIKNGQIVELPKIKSVKKLRPGDKGTCCDPRDICLVVSPEQPHVKWTLDEYHNY